MITYGRSQVSVKMMVHHDLTVVITIKIFAATRSEFSDGASVEQMATHRLAGLQLYHNADLKPNSGGDHKQSNRQARKPLRQNNQLKSLSILGVVGGERLDCDVGCRRTGKHGRGETTTIFWDLLLPSLGHNVGRPLLCSKGRSAHTCGEMTKLGNT